MATEANLEAVPIRMIKDFKNIRIFKNIYYSKIEISLFYCDFFSQESNSTQKYLADPFSA